MTEFNDSSSIKLFGKMIPLLTLNQLDDNFKRNPFSSSNSLNALDSTNHGVVQLAQSPMEDQEKHEEEEEDDDNGRSPLSEREPSSFESSKNEEKSTDQQKNLKKPSKILQCPRCNSKETKFCYYNNYNVNQPRHFCKNCQRYWTAGGAMRNVPVGAGRRKTKSSNSSAALHYPHVMMTSVDNNNNILAFGSDSSVFNLSCFSLSPAPPPHPTALYCPGFPASFYSSPVPGKHSRDENDQKGIKPSDSKTLRIDDTDIAAKSSMMATLMIKTKNTTMINSGGIFNGFQSKTGFAVDDRDYRLRTFSVLQANPVAMSRSLNFHENT